MIFLIKYLYKQNVMNRQYFYTIVCLLISLWIYVFYRTEYTVINHIVTYFAPSHYFRELKLTIHTFLPLSKFVIYSLPEGLWVFATTIISGNVVLKIRKIEMHIIYMPLIMACLIEFIQYIGLSRGVFDWFDVMVIIFFWTLGYIFVKRNDVPKTSNVTYVLFTYISVIFSYVWK
jgi:hypothetical protein